MIEMKSILLRASSVYNFFQLSGVLKAERFGEILMTSSEKNEDEEKEKKE